MLKMSKYGTKAPVWYEKNQGQPMKLQRFRNYVFVEARVLV